MSRHSSTSSEGRLEVQIKDSISLKTKTGYRMTISAGGRTWNVIKRYSEFYKFHNQLMAAGVTLNDGHTLPSIPPRNALCGVYRGNHHRRRLDLESYIQNCTEALSVEDSPALVQFLQVEPEVVRSLTSVSGDIPTIKSVEKLRRRNPSPSRSTRSTRSGSSQRSSNRSGRSKSRGRSPKPSEAGRSRSRARSVGGGSDRGGARSTSRGGRKGSVSRLFDDGFGPVRVAQSTLNDTSMGAPLSALAAYRNRDKLVAKEEEEGEEEEKEKEKELENDEMRIFKDDLVRGLKVQKHYRIAVGATRASRVLFLSEDRRRLCVDSEEALLDRLRHGSAKGLELDSILGVVEGDAALNATFRDDREPELCFTLRGTRRDIHIELALDEDAHGHAAAAAVPAEAASQQTTDDADSRSRSGSDSGSESDSEGERAKEKVKPRDKPGEHLYTPQDKYTRDEMVRLLRQLLLDAVKLKVRSKVKRSRSFRPQDLLSLLTEDKGSLASFKDMMRGGVDVFKHYRLLGGAGPASRNLRVLFLSSDGQRLCVDTRNKHDNPGDHVHAKGLSLTAITDIVAGDDLHGADVRGDRKRERCLSILSSQRNFHMELQDDNLLLSHSRNDVVAMLNRLVAQGGRDDDEEGARSA